jgi:hypothetical protein
MDACSASKKFKARSFDGWALEALLQWGGRDGTDLLRRVLIGSPLRRQVVFLTLSFMRSDPAGEVKDRLRSLADPVCWASNPDAEISFILGSRRARDITDVLVGRIEGLVGALSRLGDDPMHPFKYKQLIELLRCATSNRAKVLRQLEVITPISLMVLNLLDDAFIHPEIVRRFATVQQVYDFNSVVRLIRRVVPQVTDEELLSSLKAVSGMRSGAAHWAQRFLTRAVFESAPPIQDDDELVALRSGEAMIDAANRFGNCLKGKIPDVAVGRARYLEFRPRPAIIELLSLSNSQWVVEQVYAPKNGYVSPELLSQVLHKLSGTGILLPARLDHAQRNNGAARLLRVLDHDLTDMVLLGIGDERLDEPDADRFPLSVAQNAA